MWQKLGRSVTKKLDHNKALMPYILLTSIACLVLFIKPLNTFLSKVVLGISFPKTETGYGYVNPAVACFSPFKPFVHASMFLLISSIFSLCLYMKKGWIKIEGLKRIKKKTICVTGTSGIAIIALVIMSRIMDGTGQTSILAEGIAQFLGKAYLVFAPLVGYVGTFITGSNMSSNILFANFQNTTAKLLGANPQMVLGAHSAGATIGSVASPSKIIFGTTTTNTLGNEGAILKKVLPITLPIVFVIGAIICMLNYFQ